MKSVLALALGVLAGYVFFIAKMPLPWMLGAMVANAAASLSNLPVAAPARIRSAMTAVLGTMLGASFGAEFFSHLLTWKVTVAGMLICTLIGAATSYLILRSLSEMSKSTAYFSALPGGLVEMITLAEEGNADTRSVALVHAFRIFITVLTLPLVLGLLFDMPIARSADIRQLLVLPTAETAVWLVVIAAVGCLVGHLLQLPAKYLLGPLLLSAVVHIAGISDFTVAPVLVAVAQVVLGTNIGTRFAGFDKRLIARIAGVSRGTSPMSSASPAPNRVPRCAAENATRSGVSMASISTTLPSPPNVSRSTGTLKRPAPSATTT